MKTFTFLAIAISATVAVAQPWGQPGGSSSSASSASGASGSNQSSGQCSGNQHPACCNGDSLLGLDCLLGAILGECSGVQACCDITQDGLINLGGLCVEI